MCIRYVSMGSGSARAVAGRGSGMSTPLESLSGPQPHEEWPPNA